MKVAIIGFGTAGEARLAAYRGVAGGRLVAVADPSPSRRDRALAMDPGLLARPSLTALLEDISLDAVDICAPPAYHAELAATALRAGCHVLCEKPVAFTDSGAAALVACSRESRRLLYPAHNYGFSPMMRMLSDALAGGGIGSPMTVTFQIQRPTHARGVDAFAPDWRRDPAQAGGGILLDHGTHCVYLAVRLFGQVPASVSCTAQWSDGDEARGMDEAVDVRLNFPGGTCRIDLSWTSTIRSNLYQLSGPAGSVTIRDGEAVLEGAAGLRTRTLTSPTGSSTHEEWFADMFADFAATVQRPGRWDGPRQEILSTARIINAAYRSAAMNGSPSAVTAG
jgi:predicted dehydrogenase